MQELEKILEELKRIKDGNRKEKLYAKYPPNSKDQEVLNAYSQGYEDGTDNFYNAAAEIIHKHMNDGWIPVEKHLPEGRTRVICQFDNGDIELLWQDWESDPESLTYWTDFDFMAEKKVIAWRPLPEPYRPERSEVE